MSGQALAVLPPQPHTNGIYDSVHTTVTVLGARDLQRSNQTWCDVTRHEVQTDQRTHARVFSTTGRL